MSLWDGFKSIFVGEEDIEQESYETYRQPPKKEPAPRAEIPEYRAEPRPEDIRYEEPVRPEPEPQPERASTQRTAPRQQHQSANNRQSRQTSSVRNANTRQNYNNKREKEGEMSTTEQSSFDLVLARPNNYRDVNAIGDDLNAGKTVILNLEMVKQEDATRILDFLSGVAYANDDEIKMMAQKTYAIMPATVNFSGVDLVSELENNGYNF